MTRMLNKVSSPRRPVRKGVLAFALACLTLWGSMLASQQLQPSRPSEQHSYPLDGAAWQGITQIEFQGLEDSGGMQLAAGQAARIETQWDDPLQPRLQLQRQGDTLIVRPAPESTTKNSSGRATANRAVRIRNFYLPLHISRIQAHDLSINLTAPTTALSPQLRLEGTFVRIHGVARQIQVQLRQQAPSSAEKGCEVTERYRYTSPRLRTNLQAVELLDIHAPDGSRIELETKPENAAQLGKIRLQTGATTRLELSSLALWPKITLLPLPAEQAEAEVNCTNKAADNSSPSAEDDYSD